MEIVCRQRHQNVEQLLPPASWFPPSRHRPVGISASRRFGNFLGAAWRRGLGLRAPSAT
jgi:hypothetical protein